MRIFFHTLLWDLKMQARQQIITVAAVISLLYIGVFESLPSDKFDRVLVMFIFNDPAMLGFLFTGAIVLFEKNDRSLQALVVTPIKNWQYLCSKAVSLTLIALGCSLAMVWAGHGWQFNYLHFLSALLLTSILMVFLGFAVVSRVNNFNQYIIQSVIYFLPIGLPLLNLFEVTDTYWFYLLPTQASITLFQAAFEPISMPEILFSYAYLLLWTVFAYRLAVRAFDKNIKEKS
jgi:fluoroquinolone transport system permease protein